jgi:hypothetical protein
LVQVVLEICGLVVTALRVAILHLTQLHLQVAVVVLLTELDRVHLADLAVEHLHRTLLEV